MRKHLQQLLLSTGLASAMLLGATSVANAEPVVGGYARPREAPPPLREERIVARPGFVFIRGHWDWRGRWEWVPGRWETERRGKHFREHRWENRNGEYVFVEGGWVDLGPTAAPPPLREERIVARPGFAFIRGHWDWRGGQWTWVPGRWEAERRGKRWREHRWEMRDGVYVMVDGEWIDDVVVRPRIAPPPIREERFVARPGHVWIRGRWDWRNGQYVWVEGHYEAERPRMRWNEGHWENRGGEWVFVEGGWIEAAYPEFPTSPPPPPQVERPEPRPGSFFIAGHWAWREGRYQWEPGVYEKIFPGKHFIPGKWINRDGKFLWTNGAWVNDY